MLQANREFQIPQKDVFFTTSLVHASGPIRKPVFVKRMDRLDLLAFAPTQSMPCAPLAFRQAMSEIFPPKRR